MVITDSVSMPRPGIPYEDTWLYLLKKEFPGFDILDRPVRGGNSRRLVTEGGRGQDLLETYRPDIVIIQMGITECAPRLFNKRGIEYVLVQKLPDGMRKKYIEKVQRTRKRNPAVTDVSPWEFKANLCEYCSRAEQCLVDVVIILICQPTDQFVCRSPHIRRNIDLYNHIYREVADSFDNVTVLSPFEDIDINSVSIDPFHINAEGMRMIFDALRPVIEAKIARKAV